MKTKSNSARCCGKVAPKPGLALQFVPTLQNETVFTLEDLFQKVFSNLNYNLITLLHGFRAWK